jgi:hypothetical protein
LKKSFLSYGGASKNLGVSMRVLSGLLFLCSFFAPLQGAVFKYIDCWTLYGDYLYLQGSVPDMYFAQLTRGSDVAVVQNKPEFNSAFRWGLDLDMAEFCGILGVNYMQYRDFLKKSISVGDDSGDSLVPLNIFRTSFTGNSVESTVDLRFENGEIFYRHYPKNFGKFFMHTQVGMEIAYVRYKSGDTVTGSGGGTFTQRSQAQGVGPQIGIGGEYEFMQWCNRAHRFSLTGSVLGSLLSTEFQISSLQNYDSGGTIFNDHFQGAHSMMPALQARLGVEYASCILCFPIHLVVGFEAHEYFDSVVTQRWDTSSTLLQNLEFQNFSLQGLYFRAGIHF